jgi:hypothetical protein
MTMDEVRAIMGDCLSVVHYDGQTQWHYTRGVDGGVMSVSSHSTHIRFVSFGPDNLVAETVYDFHFD